MESFKTITETNVYIFHSPNARSSQYGIGTYLKELTKYLKYYNKFKFNFIYLEASNYKEISLIEQNGINCLYIPPPIESIANNNFSANKQLYSTRIANMLIKYISIKERIIFHFNLSADIFLAKELKLLFNCKIVYVVHSFQWYFDFNGNLKKFSNWKNLINRSNVSFYDYDFMLCELADHVICVTNEAREYIMKNLSIQNDKISTIYNGIEIDEKLFIEYNFEIIKKQLGFRKSDKIILFVGRIDEGKGINQLINSFRKIIKVYPNCHLVFIGSGNNTPIDKWLIECRNLWRNIHFIGYLSSNVVEDFYKIANIGVIPSLFEWCSYVALEMMRSKLPIVATNIGGLKEIFKNKKNALLVNVISENDGNLILNERELTEALLFLLKYKEKAQALGKTAYDDLIKNFSSKRMAENIIQVYHNII
jgi:glycosyltransferase